ncbi:MAG: peptide deformylase, partial [Actinomycetota bacterium]
MAVRQIRTFGDPVLRTPAAEVREVGDDVRSLMRDMIHTITDKDGVGGVGLAAPQIGVLRRVIVWRYEDELNVIHAGALANPKL